MKYVRLKDTGDMFPLAVEKDEVKGWRFYLYEGSIYGVRECDSELVEGLSHEEAFKFEDCLPEDTAYSKDSIHCTFSDLLEGARVRLANEEIQKMLDEIKEEEENKKPEQYRIGIDTFERAFANMNKDELMAAVRFTIDKYTWRKKNQDLSDLHKIIDYAKFGIKVLTEK